jgi:hypothetical protein
VSIERCLQRIEQQLAARAGDADDVLTITEVVVGLGQPGPVETAKPVRFGRHVSRLVFVRESTPPDRQSGALPLESPQITILGPSMLPAALSDRPPTHNR